MKRALAVAAQNLIAIHQIKGLLAHLNEGPEVLFFRGIALLGDCYPSLGEREMLDIDLLVRDRDAGRLAAILKGMGMQEQGKGNCVRKGVLFDIHTSLLNPTRAILAGSCLDISLDEIFAQGTTKELEGTRIKIPSPPHLFLSTALHLQSHSFASPKGWEDLKRIRGYYGLTDEEIRAEAARLGMTRTLFYLSALRPDLFPSWKGRLSMPEQWILQRIKKGIYNQNLGDLLFLLQSKRKGAALKEIFFPQGFSPEAMVDRLRKAFRLLKDLTRR